MPTAELVRGDKGGAGTVLQEGFVIRESAAVVCLCVSRIRFLYGSGKGGGSAFVSAFS